jgi:hypothetical protein
VSPFRHIRVPNFTAQQRLRVSGPGYRRPSGGGGGGGSSGGPEVEIVDPPADPGEPGVAGYAVQYLDENNEMVAVPVDPITGALTYLDENDEEQDVAATDTPPAGGIPYTDENDEIQVWPFVRLFS